MTDKIKDIINYDAFTKIEPIYKGWSTDKKYYAERNNGEKLLIRVSDISEYEEKKQEFDIMTQMFDIGINMPKPISFGICNNGKSVFQLLTWCEGREAKELLPLLSQQEQYNFGQKAGQILRGMEQLENYPSSPEWAKIYGAKVKKYIENYKTCGEILTDDKILISFLEKHISCLDNRPMSLLDGDFQSDNMIISPNKELYIIDFQGSGLVDPYYALTGAMVTAEVSPQFSKGQLHSYFERQVPENFWELNAFYMIAESINAFSVAVTLGQEEIDYSNKMTKVMLDWFDNFNNLIPNWYIDKKKLTCPK